MADGGYYDYSSHMDPAVMQAMGGGYPPRPEHGNYDDGQNKGPGFYTAAAHYPSMPAPNAAMDPSSQMAGSAEIQGQMALQSMMMSQQPSTTGGGYESTGGSRHSSYHVKSEKMPLTPPGSPSDPKDLSGVGGHHHHQHTSGVVTSSGMLTGDATSGLSQSALGMSMQQNLPKPVPMRRLSEKSIAQARACLGSISGPLMAPDTIMDSMNFAAASPSLARALSVVQSSQKRPRSEKKPIPEDSKDGKYFERRKRNNNAAKRSRDSRKAREDEIAIRASFLEKENAILRAQVGTLREEANSLRQLLLQKRTRP